MDDVNLCIVRGVFSHNFRQLVWQVDTLRIEPAIYHAVAVLRQNTQFEIPAMVAVAYVRADYLIDAILVREMMFQQNFAVCVPHDDIETGHIFANHIRCPPNGQIATRTAMRENCVKTFTEIG